MPNFRSPKKQAKHATQTKAHHGLPRHNNKSSGVIHSIGTERCYTQSLASVATWMQDNRLGNLQSLTTSQAHQYLSARSEYVTQKTLDLDRQAMQKHLGHSLDRIKSTVPQTALASESRVYSLRQVREITHQMPAKYALATNIALAAGLRASELLTLRKADERMMSVHREWSSNRFIGRENQIKYTVAGKGGLIREVTIPQDLAAKLEAYRLYQPKTVTDRGIYRSKQYDIPGGKKFSQKFSNSSKQALGFSLGAHGLRHTYAQERIIELQSNGYSLIEAKGVVAQELGHFSPNTTEAYLR